MRAEASSPHQEEATRLCQEYRRIRDPHIRDQIVLMHESLVRYVAARFAGRGEPLEDLIQVAWIGLIQAVERFDPERGTTFATYAVPTIVGVIQHYLRDRQCSLKIPRALQERQKKVHQAYGTLSQTLGRSPTVAEIAAHLHSTEEEILETMEAADARNTVSLDTQISIDGEASPLTIEDMLGGPDPNLEDAETLCDLKEAVACLNRRERTIIHLRFFCGLSQAEVARHLNLSQMHISRLQQKALNRLRELLVPESGEEEV